MKLIRFSDWTLRKDKMEITVKDVLVTAEYPEDVKDDPFYKRRAIGQYNKTNKVSLSDMDKYKVLKVVLTGRTFGKPANEKI